MSSSQILVSSLFSFVCRNKRNFLPILSILQFIHWGWQWPSVKSHLHGDSKWNSETVLNHFKPLLCNHLWWNFIKVHDLKTDKWCSNDHTMMEILHGPILCFQNKPIPIMKCEENHLLLGYLRKMAWKYQLVQSTNTNYKTGSNNVLSFFFWNIHSPYTDDQDYIIQNKQMVSLDNFYINKEGITTWCNPPPTWLC